MTNNVRAFVKKLLLVNKSIETIEIQLDEDIVVNEPFILLTFTTGHGEVPEKVERFLKRNSGNLQAVLGSGHKNWGVNFCKGAFIVADTYKVPCLHTFQMRGNDEDVAKVVGIIEALSSEGR